MLRTGLSMILTAMVGLAAACSGGTEADGGSDASGDPVQEDGCGFPSAEDPAVEFPGRGERNLQDCLLDMECLETMVAAHRGFHTHAPENSLPAIRAAADLGTDVVEVDVRHTADDRLVIMHDDTVDRTTDGTGSVAELAFAEIRALHLDTSRYPDFAGEDFVPTFMEALDEARGRMVVYVDMKTDRDDLLVADIQAAAAHDFVMVYSGDAGKLQRVQAADPDIYVFPSLSTRDEVDSLMPLVTPVLIEIAGELDPALVDYIHGLGVKVSRDAMGADVAVILNCDLSAWDIYPDAGIDLVQTNWPETMLPYLKR